MFSSIFQVRSRSKRGRKATPEVVPLSCQPRLKPLSCQPEPQRRHAVIVHGRLEVPLSQASAPARRVSFVEATDEQYLLGEHAAEVVHIYPSRKVGRERTERWVEACESDSGASDDEGTFFLKHSCSPSKQELIAEENRRSRRYSRSSSPSVIRPSARAARGTTRSESPSSRSGPANARSSSTARSQSKTRTASTIRCASVAPSRSSAGSATTTPSLQSSENAGSSAATSPSLVRTRSSRRSSLSTSPSLSSRTSSTTRYRYRPHDDDDMSMKSYNRCLQSRQLDEEEKKRLRRILRVAEFAAGRTR